MQGYESVQSEIAEALNLLGVERLVLAIHDQSFPSQTAEETGRGSPYSLGGRAFIEFIRRLGFNGLQFGPQGKTSLANPSPYDGSIFSKSELSISLADLADGGKWQALLDGRILSQLTERCPALEAAGSRDFLHYKYAWNAQQAALRAAFANFKLRRRDLKPLWAEFEMWSHLQATGSSGETDGWLLRDALFDAISIEYGTDDWRSWTGTWAEIDRRLYSPAPGEEQVCRERIDSMRSKFEDEIQFYFFCQFVAHAQHAALRNDAESTGLKLYGDLQIGFSQRDIWSRRQLFLHEYFMGAPPSRTNPDGQPWGYQVLDPRQYVSPCGAPGPVLELLSLRIRKMLEQFNGIRLDHPHGMVCPWVYLASETDALRAVQNGARLFSSPALADHPLLAQFAIARPDQLATDPWVARYADDWETSLDDEQVSRFASLIDVAMTMMQQAGCTSADVVCEVLSTCPYPLRRIMERYSLGRFRVTQKADPLDPHNVYRSENAAANDWIMVGNHDTKPIWRVADEWFESGAIELRAEYLAERLEPDPGRRAEFASSLASSPGKFCQAMFADLFASPARQVSVFFADLLGGKEIYNQPGTISDTNWSLRVPHDYERVYADRLANLESLSLPYALSMALRARYPQPNADVAGLIGKLEQSSSPERLTQ